VSAFRFNTRTKTRAPLPDCRVHNALIQFVSSCQDTRTHFVDILDPPFSDTACSIISCLVVGIFIIFIPKNSIVTKFCHLALRGSVIMPRRVELEQGFLVCSYSCKTFCVVVKRNLCTCKNAVCLCPENKTIIFSNANNTMSPSRTVTVSHTASQALLYVGFKHLIVQLFT